MPILDYGFNGVVRFFGGLVPHTLTASQYPDFESLKEDYARRGSIRVNVEHSHNTIFGDPSVNWLFRAWHDMNHLLADAGFDRAGETAALRLQQKQIQSHPGLTQAEKDRYCAIAEIEVLGQLDYFETHGNFPSDQYAFTVGKLAA